MKKYKVIALSVGGANNMIHKSGDVVSAHHFPDANVEKLINEGFIREWTEEEAEEERLKLEAEEAEKQKQLDAYLAAETEKQNKKDANALALQAEQEQKAKELADAEQAKADEAEKNANTSDDANQIPGPSLFDSVNDEKKEEDAIPDFDLVERKQLIATATEKGLTFASNISKKDLFDLIYKG